MEWWNDGWALIPLRQKATMLRLNRASQSMVAHAGVPTASMIEPQRGSTNYFQNASGLIRCGTPLGFVFLSISTQCALCDTGLWSGTALQFILARMSHKIRSERTKIECWCGLCADERVKLCLSGRSPWAKPDRHPAKSRIQRSPHQCRHVLP